MSARTLRDGIICTQAQGDTTFIESSNTKQKGKRKVGSNKEKRDPGDREGDDAAALAWASPPALREEINPICPRCKENEEGCLMVPTLTMGQAFKTEWIDYRPFICHCGTKMVMPKNN